MCRCPPADIDEDAETGTNCAERVDKQKLILAIKNSPRRSRKDAVPDYGCEHDQREGKNPWENANDQSERRKFPIHIPVAFVTNPLASQTSTGVRGRLVIVRDEGWISAETASFLQPLSLALPSSIRDSAIPSNSTLDTPYILMRIES